MAVADTSIWVFRLPLKYGLSPCTASPGHRPGLETALAPRASRSEPIRVEQFRKSVGFLATCAENRKGMTHIGSLRSKKAQPCNDFS